MIDTRPYLLSVLISLLFSFYSLAGELICVSCDGPAQTYVCDVEAGSATVDRAALQLYCAINIAKDKQHATCSYKRVTTSQCSGQKLSYSYLGPSNPVPTNQQVLPDTNQKGEIQFETELKTGNQETIAAPKEEEPKTLIEFSEKAVKNSKKQLKKTGEAVSNATSKTGKLVVDSTKKAGETIAGTAKSVGKSVQETSKSTWECISSFFNKC